MSDTPKNYIEHDDLCVWWDNVGKEPLDYACTCGKWVEQLSASQSRVRELEGKVAEAQRQTECWFNDAKNLAEYKVQVATGVMMSLDEYRGLVQIQDERDRIDMYLRERNGELIDAQANLSAAQSRVQELEGENARLRMALQRIVKAEKTPPFTNLSRADMRELAHAALAEQGGGE